MNTVRELRKAIRECAEVVVQVRFGSSDRWVRISKAEALALAKNVEGLSPEQAEMYTGDFGDLRDGVLFMG